MRSFMVIPEDIFSEEFLQVGKVLGEGGKVE